ncbi:PDR/VanB family oxidoreductase [Fictibacillus barbaricus]|uniref:Ferredoxin-NADP reductase n=1 Tax=Fictibacillus barbaricus TaxID=182136 RepID=A0ABU1U4M8_9BACL|nr:PDR/VanB family oxidoreductase [Fictibacillus barbaricus]MDR7074403.1 ferredoxin-NADP reductase [Fictibacillus barbaricus]
MYKEKTIPVYIKNIEEVTKYVKRFTLASIEGKQLPRFSGGSHISTYLETAKGLLVRTYSLTSHPDVTSHYQIAVRLNDQSKGGSLYWHNNIKAGDKIQISYPKNQFPLSFKAKHHVFYAAGIGITPFLSMMKELKDKGSSFELHYASKNLEFCAFYEDLNKHYPHQCRCYFSNQNKRIQTRSLENHHVGTHVYFCGPEAFINEFTSAAYRVGFHESAVHFERFHPPQPKNAAPFQVQLKDGTLIQVKKDETLLQALQNQGIEAPYSCQAGRCGTCELSVKEGEIDHYDSFLSEEQRNAQDRILTCVSRGKSSKLVIEI